MIEKFYYLVLGGGDLKYITVNTDGTEHLCRCKSTKRNERKIKRNRNIWGETRGSREAGQVISGQTEEGLIHIVNTLDFAPRAMGSLNFNQGSNMVLCVFKLMVLATEHRLE